VAQAVRTVTGAMVPGNTGQASEAIEGVAGFRFKIPKVRWLHVNSGTVNSGLAREGYGRVG